MRKSAGLLVFRHSAGSIEVLLGHMGGPLWQRRDEGAWTIPKGEYDAQEPAEVAARREFEEELGIPAPDGDYIDLGAVRQAGGKVVNVWAVEKDLDVSGFLPGTFTMAWPPRSEQIREFPELDRVQWFVPDAARTKLIKAQMAFLDRLVEAT